MPDERMVAIPKAYVCAVTHRLHPRGPVISWLHLRRPRWGEIEEAGGAQLVDARQLGQGVQAEMREEVRGCRPEERAAGAGAPPLGTDPPGLHQGVDRALAERHPADFFDLGAGDRLVIGDDGKRLDRRTRQLAGDPSLDPQPGGKIGCSAKRPAAREADEVAAAPGGAV